MAANQQTSNPDDEVYDIFPLGDDGQAPPAPPPGTGIDGLGRPTDKCTICHDLRLVDVKESSLVLGKLQRAVLAARPVLMPDPDGLPGQFIQDPWQPPFYPASQWIASAVAGCPCCRIVVSALIAFKPGWFDEFDVTSQGLGMGHKHVLATRHAGDPLSIFKVDTRQRFVGAASDVLQVMVPLGTPDPATRDGQDPPPGLAATSQHRTTIPEAAPVCATNCDVDAIAKIKRWMVTCADSHDCQELIDEMIVEGGFVPSRILDLGAVATEARDPTVTHIGDTVRLVSGADVQGSWAALSYCWGLGASENVRTLKANLEQHQRAIPVRILPATVQNAIQLARALGFRYLWIDALCIVQDDSEEWAKEAASMGSVYLHASLVIRNETSDDCRRPLQVRHAFTMPNLATTYKMRDFDFDNTSFRSLVASAQMTRLNSGSLSDNACEPDAIYVRLGSGILHQMVSTWNQAAIFPLGARAWTLQEGFLATRSLRLTTLEMSWRCLRKNFCECQEPSLEAFRTVQSIERFMRLQDVVKDPHISLLLPGGPERLFPNDAPAFALFCWTQLVKNYSARLLTDAHDKLAAISGLSEVFGKIFRDCGVEASYLAGHWAHGLLESLLWTLDGHRGVDPQLGAETQATLSSMATSFASTNASLSKSGVVAAWSMFNRRDWRSAARSGKPVQSLDYTDLVFQVPGVLEAKMHPSWSWSSVPFAVTWPAQSPYRDPISAEELGCRFFPSAQVMGHYTCPAPWDAKQRVTNGLIMLSGKLYPVQARSMTWTAKGYESPGHLPGTFLPKDFVLATTASPAVHHVRFPSDCAIRFSPDLPCLYGDGVVEDYRAWSALLAESLCEEEKRAVAAIHRHRAAAGLGGGATSERSRAGGSRAVPGSQAAGMADRFPCWKRPPLPEDLDPKTSTAFMAIVDEAKFSRFLCPDGDCACRQGWTSRSRHPLWAMKVGTYRMDRRDGQTFLKDYFLVLAKSPFPLAPPDCYVRVGLAMTEMRGDFAGRSGLYGEGEDAVIMVE